MKERLNRLIHDRSREGNFRRINLTHQFKHVFWVLKRTVSMSWVGRDRNFYTFLVVLRHKRLMRLMRKTQSTGPRSVMFLPELPSTSLLYVCEQKL